MSDITYKPIGVIHTPFKERHGTPIQPRACPAGIEGVIELLPEMAPALEGLEGFSHMVVIFHLHKSTTEWKKKVVPYLDDTERGVLATRAPVRPNNIGLSTVRLLRIDGSKLFIESPDMLDGTPVLDIKPYIPAFDEPEGGSQVHIGWLSDRISSLEEAGGKKDDGRFEG